MEVDAGAALVNNSPILKESNLQVRVVIGDENSSTIAAIRKETHLEVFKLADKNHLVKHFVNDLYELAKTFKEVGRRGVMGHIKKCFTYAKSQNTGCAKNIAKILRALPLLFLINIRSVEVGVAVYQNQKNKQ